MQSYGDLTIRNSVEIRVFSEFISIRKRKWENGRGNTPVAEAIFSSLDRSQ